MKTIAIVLHGMSLACLTEVMESCDTNDVVIHISASEDHLDRSNYSCILEDVCANIIDAIDLVQEDQYCVGQENTLTSDTSFYFPILVTCVNRGLCRGSPI